MEVSPRHPIFLLLVLPIHLEDEGLAAAVAAQDDGPADGIAAFAAGDGEAALHADHVQNVASPVDGFDPAPHGPVGLGLVALGLVALGADDCRLAVCVVLPVYVVALHSGGPDGSGMGYVFS